MAPLSELALFAGAGGGLLASKHLLGHRVVCYVEREPYCVEVLKARIRDSHLDDAPVWDDVRTFDGKPWRGLVDIVSGGFPCQPFSSAAHGRNNAADLWPDMLRIVSEVEPRFVFAENVKREPIEQAARDLAHLGYHATACRLDASDVAATHRRTRWWLVADAYGESEPRFAQHEEVACLPVVPRLVWDDDAAPLGVDDGMAHRMDRLRAIGNGQVPLVAASAWRNLRRLSP